MSPAQKPVSWNDPTSAVPPLLVGTSNVQRAAETPVLVMSRLGSSEDSSDCKLLLQQGWQKAIPPNLTIWQIHVYTQNYYHYYDIKAKSTDADNNCQVTTDQLTKLLERCKAFKVCQAKYPAGCAKGCDPNVGCWEGASMSAEAIV